MATLSFQLAGKISKFREGKGEEGIGKEARFPVLIALALRMNGRKRSFPSIEQLMEDTGYGRTAILSALVWLMERMAIYSVPNEHRVGRERNVHPNKTVWQLTGIIDLGGEIVMYLHMRDEEVKSMADELETIGAAEIAALFGDDEDADENQDSPTDPEPDDPPAPDAPTPDDPPNLGTESGEEAGTDSDRVEPENDKIGTDSEAPSFIGNIDQGTGIKEQQQIAENPNPESGEIEAAAAVKKMSSAMIAFLLEWDAVVPDSSWIRTALEKAEATEGVIDVIDYAAGILRNCSTQGWRNKPRLPIKFPPDDTTPAKSVATENQAVEESEEIRLHKINRMRREFGMEAIS